jgi:hypothetical protein
MIGVLVMPFVRPRTKEERCSEDVKQAVFPQLKRWLIRVTVMKTCSTCFVKFEFLK